RQRQRTQRQVGEASEPLQAIPSQQCNNPNPKNYRDGANGFLGIDFRLPGTAVLEDDGRLANATTGFPAAIKKLLLKRIAARKQVIQVGFAEFRHAITPVSAAGVVGRNAQEQPDDGVDSPTEQPP